MPDEVKIPSLARIIAEINKKNGEQVIGRIKDFGTLEIERIPTGIKSLDDALGGGFPKSRIIELYGLPSGGKSLISLLLVKKAQEAGLDCIYLDVEDSFDPKWAKNLGIDVDKLVIAQSTIGEDTMNMVCKLLEARPGVIIIDSVAAMVPRIESEEDLEKPTMALKARLMSRGLAKINSLNKNTLIVFINQLRSTLSMYGPQTTTPGGRALGHFASIRIEIKKGDFLRVEDKKTTPIIGQVVNFNITKNKTAAPFKLGNFKFFYEDCRVEE